MGRGLANCLLIFSHTLRYDSWIRTILYPNAIDYTPLGSAHAAGLKNVLLE